MKILSAAALALAVCLSGCTSEPPVPPLPSRPTMDESDYEKYNQISKEANLDMLRNALNALSADDQDQVCKQFWNDDYGTVRVIIEGSEGAFTAEDTDEVFAIVLILCT